MFKKVGCSENPGCPARDAELPSEVGARRSKYGAVRWFLRGAEVPGLAFFSLCFGGFIFEIFETGRWPQWDFGGCCGLEVDIYGVLFVFFAPVLLGLYGTAYFFWWCGIFDQKYLRFSFFTTAVLFGFFACFSQTFIFDLREREVGAINILIIVSWVLSFSFSLILLLFFKKNEKLFLIVCKALGILGHTVGIVGSLIGIILTYTAVFGAYLSRYLFK